MSGLFKQGQGQCPGWVQCHQLKAILKFLLPEVSGLCDCMSQSPRLAIQGGTGVWLCGDSLVAGTLETLRPGYESLQKKPRMHGR